MRCLSTTEIFRPQIAAVHVDRSRMPMSSTLSPLLTDLYQLSMIQAYLERGEDKTAVFEFFVRSMAPRRRFLMATALALHLLFFFEVRALSGSLVSSTPE